jgi:hypothetical protein
MSDSVNVKLSANRYGKDKIRVLRVLRSSTGGKETVLEFNVRLTLEGDFETRLVDLQTGASSAHL